MTKGTGLVSRSVPYLCQYAARIGPSEVIAYTRKNKTKNTCSDFTRPLERGIGSVSMNVENNPNFCLAFPPQQLTYSGADGNMIPFPPGPLDQNVVESQAVAPDYYNSTYSRGHLNPSLHHQKHEDRSATFTFTNVVPQKSGSNEGPWEILEQTINRTLDAFCLGEAYIVTGVMPYQDEEHWLKNHRVAVPEYLWSAYCCPNYNTSLPIELEDAFPTYAAVGRNDRNSSEDIVPISPSAKKQFRGYDVRKMSLETLEVYLRDRFKTIISVFYDQCSGSN